ncbi:hypothetical protein [Enterococcus columbae]|nr:hypothetical protein [Enterococcus columbae]
MEIKKELKIFLIFPLLFTTFLFFREKQSSSDRCLAGILAEIY